MKKVVMLACAIALVGVVHATSVGWTLAGAKDYAGDAYSFFLIGQNDVSSVEQITALVAAGTDVSKYAMKSGIVADNGAASVGASASGVSVPGGSKYEAFFIIFDSDTAASAGNYIAVTSAQNAQLIQSPGASAATATFIGGNQATYLNEPKNWAKVQGSGVPEPTSGLLLLMGMAALALKRKVA